MAELLKTQTCPYCNDEVEDCRSIWDYEADEEVTCDSCGKVYVVKPQYKFEGWLIEEQCQQCGEWTDDGYKMCDCGEYSEKY